MVDSGSVGTFVSKNIAKELNLFIIPKQKTIALDRFKFIIKNKQINFY